MATVADVVQQAIARERARCAAVVRDMRDVCLGRGDMEGAETLGMVLNEIEIQTPILDAAAAAGTPPTAPRVVDDDDDDFDAINRQVSARMFGYGRD